MGGQQFGTATILLDTSKLSRVLRLDKQRGLVEVEAGIQWPELISQLHALQQGEQDIWTIRQKQTGVDRVSLAGSLAANAHGRGLQFPPLVADVESLVLVDARGQAITCSRHENAELFSLAVGGYGLFGVICRVTLRLVRRKKLRRSVQIIPIKDLLPGIDRCLQGGALYGDCQYATDLSTDAAMHLGVFTCYYPVPDDTPVPERQKSLSANEWAELYRLARTDKRQAFEVFANHYRQTDGQVYYSDTHQLAAAFDGYRTAVDVSRGTEVITEVYVHRDEFLPFLLNVRQDFLEHNVDMTYGTIRFIERDADTFLPWATEPYVCIVCNLHVVHTADGKQKAADDFRRIIDRVIEHGGRYFLTYHRFASRQQVEKCYPKFVDFLRLKDKYDPEGRFQSDWYRHYRRLFSDRLPA